MLKDKKIDILSRVASNSAAMLASTALAKCGGLIVTIMVARYLSASSLGIYAVVLSLTLLLEVVSTFGLRFVVIRSISRDNLTVFNYWKNASANTIGTALTMGAVLLAVLFFFSFTDELALALFVSAIGLPAAGLNLIAQSVLQGVEKMEYQPVAALVGRLAGLLVLTILLHYGAGVWSAFLGRMVFQCTSLGILSTAILHYVRRKGISISWIPQIDICRKIYAEAIPFGLQAIVNEGLVRLHIVILPLLIAFESVGYFNAANQITQTLTTFLPVLMLTVLPLFSRTFDNNNGAEKSALSEHTLKFILVLVFPFVIVVSLLAQEVLAILFGVNFKAAAPVLQILILSQIFIASDSVMTQNMIASDNERPMLVRSAIGGLVSIALTFVLGKYYGVIGVAVAVVLARSFLFTLNAQYVSRHICNIKIVKALIKPLICISIPTIPVFILFKGKALAVIAIIGIYILLLPVFKLITLDELSIIKKIIFRLFQNLCGLIAGKKSLR